MKKIVIGVMGPGAGATQKECETAFEIGEIIANFGCILLTGGVGHGVMDAASRGAKQAGGTTIGVLPHKLPSDTHPVSEFVDFTIVTTFGEGRNIINVLSCDILVVVGMCPGTASEVCFAIKAGKPVTLLENSRQTWDFFRQILGGTVQLASDVQKAQGVLRLLLQNLTQ